MIRRGDIVLVLFPNSDLITAKQRPALIVQADNLQTNLNQVIIAMITSKMSRAGHSSRVTILINSHEGQQSGLLTDSVIMTDNLATITLNAVYRIIGSISMETVSNALRYTLAL
ncbi:type II toxin-antitoxin system PemK/MazF family toxin [Crocosphaera sp. XPORK-15E]|uniref:type II toxin-antitoxin system PemK/MazF family toxin n=1 Tax=Crocosphaera sp. XPORK-15E TaxID=3110247 RepID=UPI002B20282D|nr:type II toxin-antitoxin system PemK/MazF family toxin [Crocosphaera sp. XPORK-15E]MEA5536021.1 type II toxin-antitoxin system PemK/MazF family toxin [Crocosphaera sp. XPORK-15E]